ncbi:hypothetical protein BMS3Abin05_00491 [bacterium BMS3Abin05]|nr:hypothetical protein BMS3Abin05_00491 [bacterium BMS3Abin05]GBE26555.1 hypothetical protein BMS3Bbin03_00468 [bacterium BMS3Bbin03]HDL78613.1 zf-HC2 domain-containing protein [Bacteroidota bacterium]
MISCDQFSSFITDYLEGYLGERKKSQFEAHLMACESCRAALQGVKLVRKQLHEMSSVHTSPTFNVVLRSRLRQELEREGFWEHIFGTLFSRRTPAYGLAVLSLVAISFFAANQFFPANTPGKISRKSHTPNSVISARIAQPAATAKSKSAVEERVRYVLDEVSVSETSRTHLNINSTGLNNYKEKQTVKTAVNGDSTASAMFPFMPLGRAVSVIF